jgi:hypothetical protein
MQKLCSRSQIFVLPAFVEFRARKKVYCQRHKSCGISVTEVTANGCVRFRRHEKSYHRLWKTSHNWIDGFLQADSNQLCMREAGFVVLSMYKKNSLRTYVDLLRVLLQADSWHKIKAISGCLIPSLCWMLRRQDGDKKTLLVSLFSYGTICTYPWYIFNAPNRVAELYICNNSNFWYILDGLGMESFGIF